MFFSSVHDTTLTLETSSAFDSNSARLQPQVACDGSSLVHTLPLTLPNPSPMPSPTLPTASPPTRAASGTTWAPPTRSKKGEHPPHRPFPTPPIHGASLLIFCATLLGSIPLLAAANPGPSDLLPHPPAVSTTPWIEHFLHKAGFWAPLAFVALYALTCVACVPGVFLVLAAGAAFGAGHGFLYTWVGAQLGASIAFFISRHVARPWVARRLAQHPLLEAIEGSISQQGWRIVALLRLAPGSPFFLLNYLFGLTAVRYRDYAVATALASIPGTLFFAYLGSLGYQALAGRQRTPLDWTLHGLGLIALASGLYLIARGARRRLQQHPPPPTPSR